MPLVYKGKDMIDQTTDAVKENKQDLKYQRDKDRQPVKGIFRFYEVPGGSMSFNFKKYKQDTVERFDLVDGQVYTLPLGVAKHLNSNGSYPVHQYIKDEGGNVSMRVGKKVNRFGFQSLEFMDIDDMPNNSSEVVIVDEVKDDKIFRKTK